jgi:hypothetical protein
MNNKYIIEDGTGFNISCSKATNETKIPVMVTQWREITEITLEPNHDNGLPSADNNCGENNVTSKVFFATKYVGFTSKF